MNVPLLLRHLLAVLLPLGFTLLKEKSWQIEQSETWKEGKEKLNQEKLQYFKKRYRQHFPGGGTNKKNLQQEAG